MKKAILNLGNGNLQQGCDTVVLQLLEPGKSHPIQRTASLPPAASLEDLYHRWQQLYLIRNETQLFRIHLAQPTGLRYSESKFKTICEALSQQLNEWLNSDLFRSIDQALRTAFHRDEEFQVILVTNSRSLHQLPWHLWQFLEDYPRAELALGQPDWQELPEPVSTMSSCRVLALLGDHRGIDIETDCKILKSLPGIELEVLKNSSHREFNEHLWDERGWDILFFAGHSQTIGQEGQIHISDTESLTIPQLKYALQKAITKGLKLAIFNSCDGIGLAHQLADLNLPYTIVMREPVPDLVAQAFLRFFFQSFSEGLSFHLAVREARQKLETLESEVPCASWLPVIWQNPTAAPFEYSNPRKSSEPIRAIRSLRQFSSWRRAIMIGCAMTGLMMGVRSFGLLEVAELAAYDYVMRQRPLESVDDRILVIEVTGDDTNRYGYPLPDATLVQVLQKLDLHQPRAIGLDMHRPQPRGESQLSLSQYFEESETLFMVCSYSSQDNSYTPAPISSEEKLINQVGFSDLLVDSFNWMKPGIRSDLVVGEPLLSTLTVRRQLLSYDPDLLQLSSTCSTPYSFSFQLAFQFLDAEQVQPLDVNSNQEWQFGDVVFSDLSARFGGYQQLDGASSQVLLNYRSNQPGRRVSLSQFLEGSTDPSLIQDQIILIGYTAPVARDAFDTPYGAMEGVWIHAHMVSQMISAVLDERPLIWTLPQWRSLQWGDTVWVFGWAAIGGLLTWGLSAKPRWYLGLAIVVAGWVLYELCLIALIQGLWLPLIPAGLALLAASGVGMVQRRTSL